MDYMSHVLFAFCAFTDSVRGILALLLSINK